MVRNMKDKKIFTIVGLICIFIGIFVIVFTAVKHQQFNIFTVLPLIFAIACFIVARLSK